MDDAPNRTGRRDTPALVARALDNPLTLLFARICLTLPFLAAGVAKLFAWNAGVAGMADHGLEPAWAFNLATVVTDFGGSTLVILDRKTWLGAGALGIFTVVATLIAHRFWELTGPARAAGFSAFLEHAAIGAAFIFVVVVGLRRRDRLE